MKTERIKRGDFFQVRPNDEDQQPLYQVQNLGSKTEIYAIYRVFFAGDFHEPRYVANINFRESGIEAYALFINSLAETNIPYESIEFWEADLDYRAFNTLINQSPQNVSLLCDLVYKEIINGDLITGSIETPILYVTWDIKEGQIEFDNFSLHSDKTGQTFDLMFKAGKVAEAVQIVLNDANTANRELVEYESFESYMSRKR